jgi:FixJ family two-component response regulator
MIDQELVYLVDDDPALLRALARLLEEEGLASQGFGSAEQFLLAQDPDQRGCVVADLRLPGMDGLALQQALLAPSAPSS